MDVSEEALRTIETFTNAVNAIAGQQVRAAATIGGLVASKLTYSEVLVLLCALKAEVQVMNTSGVQERVKLIEYIRGDAKGIVTRVIFKVRKTGEPRYVLLHPQRWEDKPRHST
eukprot:GABW01004764.1.p2 GENE.GABW01004764.1~~GABW01004764.1.p2  ORF type:complete len:114 (-),score=60.09 GABW01004764.1:3-344(-)